MAKKNPGSLNDQQERFCQEYLIDLNATKAAERAGYSANTATEQGSRLLTNVKVQERVNQLKLERGERTKVTADRVLQEIQHMAMFDPKDFVRIKNPEQIATLPEEVRRAIIGWGWNKQGDFEIKFAKTKGVEMLGRHHKLFTDKLEVSGKVELADRLAKARKRVKGEE